LVSGGGGGGCVDSVNMGGEGVETTIESVNG